MKDYENFNDNYDEIIYLNNFMRIYKDNYFYLSNFFEFNISLFIYINDKNVKRYSIL